MTANYMAGSFYVGRYGLSWHGGEKNRTPIEAGDTVTTGLIKGGMYGIELAAVPMFIDVDGKMIACGKKQLVMKNVPWRKDGLQILGRQVDRYEGVSNQAFAEILDPLCAHYQLAGVCQVGTVGQAVIIQLEMDGFEVGGNEREAHRTYLMVSTNHLTGRDMWGVVTVRVVCENTYNAAMAQKGKEKSLPSGRNAVDILKFRSMIEERAISQRQAHIFQLNKLFTTKAETNDLDNLCNVLFPTPTIPKLVNIRNMGSDIIAESDGQNATVNVVAKNSQRAYQLYQNALDRRDAHSQAFRNEYTAFCDTTPYAAGTKYALWQAVTGHVNHSSLFESPADVHFTNLFMGNLASAQTAAFAYLNQ